MPERKPTKTDTLESANSTSDELESANFTPDEMGEVKAKLLPKPAPPPPNAKIPERSSRTIPRPPVKQSQ